MTVSLKGFSCGVFWGMLTALQFGLGTVAVVSCAAFGCSEGTRDPSRHGAETIGDAGALRRETTDAENEQAQETEVRTDIDTSTNRYDADHDFIQYTGRIDFANPKKPEYTAPGVYVTARFLGDSLKVRIEDSNLFGSERSFYDVVVDGEHEFELIPEGSLRTHPVDLELAPGEHRVVVSRRTQASIGVTRFMGFEFGGQILEPEARPARRIEIIGDSISVGEGNEGSGSDECGQNTFFQSGGWGQPYHNARQSYGAMLARQLDAEYHITAASGIGMVRNYSDRWDPRPLPEVYEQLFLAEQGDEPQRYDLSEFVPDVVLIALGTNDFSRGDAPADMPREILEPDVHAEAYISFVERLRGYYPDSHIFALSSPLLSDSEAEGAKSRLIESILRVAEHFEEAGDDRVHAHVVDTVSGRGCTGHPNVEQHQAMADELEPIIREVLGWE